VDESVSRHKPTDVDEKSGEHGTLTGAPEDERGAVVSQAQSGDWGIGGNPLTTADVTALAMGQPVG